MYKDTYNDFKSSGKSLRQYSIDNNMSIGNIHRIVNMF